MKSALGACGTDPIIVIANSSQDGGHFFILHIFCTSSFKSVSGKVFSCGLMIDNKNKMYLNMMIVNKL